MLRHQPAGCVLGFLLIPLALFVFALSSVWAVFDRKAKRKQLRETKTTPIGDVKPGIVEVVGKLKAIDKPLIAPWSEVACVHFYFQLDRAAEHQGRHRLFGDEGFVRASIDDGTGEIEVDLQSLELKIEHGQHGQSGLFDPAAPELAALVARYGETVRHRIAYAHGSPGYKENVLKPGDEVYVIGSAVLEEGRLILRRGAWLGLLSDTAESGLEAILQAEQKKALTEVWWLLAASAVTAFFIGRDLWPQ